MADIKKLVKYTPDELYVITKQSLGIKLLKKIHFQSFKVLDAHKTISDSKIISIMKLYKNRDNMILISSDSDFAREANSYLKYNKLHWIIVDSNKRAISMRVNIGSSNLTISTLAKKRNNETVCTKKVTKNRHRQFKKVTTIGTQDSRVSIYIGYYIGKLQRARKKLTKLYRKLRYHFRQLFPQKSEGNRIEVHPNNPTEGRRDLFRRNFKGKRVKAGTLQFNQVERKF